MKCKVCDERETRGDAEVCTDCTMLALRGYGWAQGTVQPDGRLRRGPADRSALDELEERQRKAREGSDA